MRLVKLTGLSYPAVRASIDFFEAGGWAALRRAHRGRARGDGRVLSAAQEDAIQHIIIVKHPEQLKMDFFLWSGAEVGQLIEQEYGLKLQVRSIGKYLARWGFTPKCPIKSAYEQNTEAVQAWLQGEYPGIEQRTRHEGTEIHLGDETAITNTNVRERSYAHVGNYSVALTVGGTPQKLSVIVTNQGKTRWMIIEESFDTDTFGEFLQALIKYSVKKAFLILDALRIYHSKIVRVWVAEREEQIELFYLPSYSPQFNSEERVNADLKQEMSKRVPVRAKAKLRQTATGHLTVLEQTPERVIGRFQNRHVKYAA